jgi:hypothetical protein
LFVDFSRSSCVVIGIWIGGSGTNDNMWNWSLTRDLSDFDSLFHKNDYLF